MSDITLIPCTAPFAGDFRPPGSKSLTNRALALAALAEGTSRISNILLADDTRVMLDGLRTLGFSLTLDEPAGTLTMEGQGGTIPSRGAEVFCGNSGTTIRFLSAVASLGRGSFTFDGVARMRQRPIGELGAMLTNLGVRIAYPLQEGFAPLRIDADLLPGGRLHFGAAQSSQFLSAVLQVAPYARHEIRVDLGSRQTSWPYVAMTMRLMDHFGHTPELIRDPETREPRQIIVPRGRYQGTDYEVEPDASNASYFLAAAALCEGARVTVQGLGKESLQGDIGLADLLQQMGADRVFGRDFTTITGTGRLEGIEVSMADMPDMAQTLGVVALFARGPTVMHDLHTLRVKETDRIAALAAELRKCGAVVDVDDDGAGDSMTITPPERVCPAQIDTYDDHRMAMSFAVAGTRAAGITIRNCQCVNKTYPRFFDDLQKLCGIRYG